MEALELLAQDHRAVDPSFEGYLATPTDAKQGRPQRSWSTSRVPAAGREAERS